MLFGCQFEVLNFKDDQKETTKGMWFGSSPKAPEIVCMDLEGTDSVQRTENRHKLERQTALFALTLTELLIINIWSNQIGLATGMSIDALRAIIMANIRLFTHDSKKVLLFLIRDQPSDKHQHDVASKKHAKNIITTEIEKIWNSIEKPASLKESKLDTLFTIKFYFLPPMH